MCHSYTTASSAPAKGGGFSARMASLLGLRSRSTPSPLPVASGRVPNTAKLLTPDGESILTPDRLETRARLKGNLTKKQVQAYVKTHQILAKGRCSDAN